MKIPPIFSDKKIQDAWIEKERKIKGISELISGFSASEVAQYFQNECDSIEQKCSIGVAIRFAVSQQNPEWTQVQVGSHVQNMCAFVRT